jgi:hypothetical protein
MMAIENLIAGIGTMQNIIIHTRRRNNMEFVDGAIGLVLGLIVGFIFGQDYERHHH